MTTTATTAHFVDEYEKTTMQDGVELFNDGRHFQCHEVLEPLWLKASASESDFYFALRYVCLALRNLETKGYAGARYMLEASIPKLQTYPDAYKGIDVKSFAEGLKKTLIYVEELGRENAEFDFGTVPDIEWLGTGAEEGEEEEQVEAETS